MSVRAARAGAICALAICSYLCTGPDLRAQDWTEQAVIQEFLAKSPFVRETKARTDATRAEAEGRTLYSNPSVNFSYEGAGLNQFLEIQQALTLSGRRRFLREAGNAAVAASEEEGAARLWNLRIDVRQAFYRLLAAQEYETTLADGIADLDGTIRILLDREREGEGSRYDRLRAERERAEIRSQLASARSVLAQARADLAVYLPVQTVIARVAGTFVIDSVVPAADQLVVVATSTRAEYRMGQQQTARYQAEQKAAERLRFPDPTVTLGLKRAEEPRLASPNQLTNPIGYGAAASISIPIPLFNKGRSEVERFRAEQELVSARREALERKIRAEVTGAREALVLRQTALETYRAEASQTSSELSRIAQTAYREGEIGILELLDSYRVNLKARTSIVRTSTRGQGGGT